MLFFVSTRKKNERKCKKDFPLKKKKEVEFPTAKKEEVVFTMMMIIPVVVGYLSGEKERGSSALLVKNEESQQRDRRGAQVRAISVLTTINRKSCTPPFTCHRPSGHSHT